MNATVEDLVEWVMKHKRNKVFRGLETKEAIRNHLLEALNRKQLLVDFDESSNEIIGIVIFRKIIHVESTLTIRKYSFAKMLKLLYSIYGPWVSGQAYRRGRLVTYNRLEQFMRKVD